MASLWRTFTTQNILPRRQRCCQQNRTSIFNELCSCSLACWCRCLTSVASKLTVEWRNTITFLQQLPLGTYYWIASHRIGTMMTTKFHKFLNIYTFFPFSHPPSLNNLIQLYVGRSYHVWKDVELLPWLERNANKCLDEMERDPTIPTSCEEKRKTRYQGTPRNIYRHILLSDIKDATATLPRVRSLKKL